LTNNKAERGSGPVKLNRSLPKSVGRVNHIIVLNGNGDKSNVKIENTVSSSTPYSRTGGEYGLADNTPLSKICGVYYY